MSDPAGSLGTKAARAAGFTLVELIVVMAIILVLAGLVLGTSGYIYNKSGRARAEAEINAMSAALENYKADNGVYPSLSSGSTAAPSASDSLNAQTATPSFASYQSASAILYQNLSGDGNNDGVVDTGAKAYMTFKPNQLSTTTPYYVQDPFGYSYGYSTAGQYAVTTGNTQSSGYNPTFDLWSTAGSTTSTGQVGWVKNW